MEKKYVIGDCVDYMGNIYVIDGYKTFKGRNYYYMKNCSMYVLESELSLVKEKTKMEKKYRVLRVLEYEGTLNWLKKTFAKNSIPLIGEHSTDEFSIRSGIVGDFPQEVIEEKEEKEEKEEFCICSGSTICGEKDITCPHRILHINMYSCEFNSCCGVIGKNCTCVKVHLDENN